MSDDDDDGLEPPPEHVRALLEAQIARELKKAAESDKVGFERPPKAHRFKPGQSGNPKGRPKKNKMLQSHVEDLLSKKLPITLGGKRVKKTVLELAMLQLAQRVAHGDMKAIKMVHDLSRQVSPLRAMPESNPEELARRTAMAASISHFLNDYASMKKGGKMGSAPQKSDSDTPPKAET